jgi:AcrR family transcriptional regulator
MNEPMAGGALALDARDRCLSELARLTEKRYEGLDPATPAPDFSPLMLLGGVFRFLASRLRRGEPILPALSAELLRWIEAYEQPLSEHRWRVLKPERPLPISPLVPEETLRAPEKLPAGRLKMSDQEVARNQRQRILFAAARIAGEKGYIATTVGDITKAARVDGRVFYAMFADKQEAFMAVHEFGSRRVMDVTAGAFFSGATWPERQWEGSRAFTQFLERNPLITRVGFVEAYAVGPGAAQRVEDSHAAFAMLLQDGYRYAAESAHPPRLVLEAIITTAFEIVYHRARAVPEKLRLSGLAPHLSFLILSPFTGPQEANAFIDRKLESAPR